MNVQLATNIKDRLKKRMVGVCQGLTDNGKLLELAEKDINLILGSYHITTLSKHREFMRKLHKAIRIVNQRLK